MRRVLLHCLALLLALNGTLALLPAMAEETTLGAAEVTASSLNLRGGPSTSHAVIRSLPNGEKVTILETQDGWAHIGLSDDTVGWVAAKYLGPTTPIADPESNTPESAAETDPATEPAADSIRGERKGSGSRLGSILKWGCLGGAITCGALALMERSSGDDDYAKYETAFREGDQNTADKHYDDATAHDDQAMVFGIVGGTLLGLFALQQFVLGDDDDASSENSDQTSILGTVWPLSYEPATRTVRLTAVSMSF